MTADLGSDASAQTHASRAGAAELPPEAMPRPVLPPASSEAIFNGLLPVQPALAQMIELVDEVDGISLDGVPYFNDAAILIDDLPQADPPAEDKPAETRAAALPALAPAASPLMRADSETVEPAQLRADQAERAYQDEREISAVRPESVPADPAVQSSPVPPTVENPVASAAPDSAEPAAIDQQA